MFLNIFLIFYRFLTFWKILMSRSLELSLIILSIKILWVKEMVLIFDALSIANDCHFQILLKLLFTYLNLHNRSSKFLATSIETQLSQVVLHNFAWIISEVYKSFASSYCGWNFLFWEGNLYPLTAVSFILLINSVLLFEYVVRFFFQKTF